MTHLNWILGLTGRVCLMTGRVCRAAGLGGKIAVALSVCLMANLLIAQAPPAAPAAPTFAAKVEEDPNTGYKRLVPLAAYYGDAKARAAHVKIVTDKIRPALTGQRPLAEARKDIENYYNLIYFPNLTQYSEDALRILSDERIRFIRDHLEQSGAKAPEVHAALNGLALNVLTGIVQDNFHPAVRYNAMLIISSLNDQEAARSAGKDVPAQPMQRALKVIVDEFKRAENPDAVRMAALLGITWHLEAEAAKPPNTPPAPWKAQVVDELLKFAENPEAPEGRSAEGHTWMRRRAIDALAIACQSKADEKVAAAMEKLLRDDSEPLALRTTVAMALGKMSLQGLTIDVPSLAKELGYVALLACDTELTRVIAQRKEEAERMARLMGTYSGEMGGYGGGSDGGGMMTPGYGASPYGGSSDGYGAATGYAGPRPTTGMTGATPGDGYGTESMAPDPSLMDPKHYRFDLIRRKMRSDLYCVQMGLTGGDDHVRPKAGGAASGAKSGAKDNGQDKDKRGLTAIAKPNERQVVINVYYDVRDLVDMIENRATDTLQLERELRKRMTKLENQVGKRTPAASAGAGDEDLPGAVSAVAPAKAGANAKAGGKAGGKAAPAGKAPAKAPGVKAPVPAKAPVGAGKSAWRPAPTFQPKNVFGSVRR